MIVKIKVKQHTNNIFFVKIIVVAFSKKNDFFSFIFLYFALIYIAVSSV